jgi:23S rRNA-intervening sequence protein
LEGITESLIQKKSFEFALEIIRLYLDLQNKREYVLSKQLLRSGTSNGANVEETSAAQSRKDFLSKMSIASRVFQKINDPKPVIASETECSEAIKNPCDCFIPLRSIRNDNWAFFYLEYS